MFAISLLASIAYLYFIHLSSTFGEICWSIKACIDIDICAIKGGISQAGLCLGPKNIQCCSCDTCMDARLCLANNGVPYGGICQGTSDIQCCNMVSVFSTGNDSLPNNNAMMLTDLADILRSADLDVIEVEDWKIRGHGGMMSVKGILIHHTETLANGDFPSLRIVRDGRSDLSGPLSQLGLGRTGTWYVIAAGRSYHAGKTIDDSLFGNYNAIGIEAEGVGIPPDESGHKYWPEVQWESYVRGVRALQAAYQVPTERVLGHKEAAVPLGRKSDPNFSMDEFRNALG